MISRIQKNSFGVRINAQKAPDTLKELEKGRILAPDLAMDIALRNFHNNRVNQDQLVKTAEQEATPTYASFQATALNAIFGNK